VLAWGLTATRSALAPPKTLIDRTTPLLRERIRGVFQHLPKALAGEEEAIHRMRVSGRRLRVALPLLARKPGGRRVRVALGILGQIRSAAGSSRDLDVGVALLDERLRSGEAPGREAKTLLRRLRAARARSRARMAETLMDLEIARLRRHLRRVLSRRGDGLFAVLLRLGQERDARGAALLAALAWLDEDYDPDALHRLRIGARRLRYVAELSEGLKGTPAEASPLFKGLQEQLGQIRDAYVLSAWLGRQAEAARTRGQDALAAEAAAQQAFFLDLSRAHHRKFLDGGAVTTVTRGLEALGAASAPVPDRPAARAYNANRDTQPERSLADASPDHSPRDRRAPGNPGHSG
jgi:CHAD domain-containing protein